MRKYLIATTAMVVFATPAVAKDHSGYVGGDIGAVWPKKQSIHGFSDFSGPVVCPPIVGAVCTTPPVDITDTDLGRVKYKTGWDADLIGGYDFGMFRLEGQLGYMHSKIKRHDFNTFIGLINTRAGAVVIPLDSNFGVDTKAHAWDAMINGWLDFGGETGIGGGVEIGRAHV